MARRPEKDSVSDMEGRPNWSLLERSDLSEEFEAILNQRDKSALKNFVGQTDKWKALRKDLLVQAVDLLAGNVKKPKQRRTLDVPLKDLYAHACNVRARLDGVGYVKTWECFAIKVERRQPIPKSAGGLKIEPRISLAYLESDEGKTVGQKLIALALFDVFDRLKTLKKVYKEGKPKNKRSMAYSEFQLAENARHYFGSKYFDDDNYWKERQA